MICPNCNKTITDDSIFCCYCGFKQQQKPEYLCNVCGKEYEPSQVYCKYCGHRLELSSDVTYRDYTAGIDDVAQNTSNQESFTDSNICVGAGIPNNAVPNVQPPMYQPATVVQSPVYQTAPTPQVNNQTAPVQPQPISSQLVAVSPSVTWYKGNKSFGYSTTNGKLNLYTDKIEFASTFNANIFSSDARGKIMHFSEILNITKGKYAIGSSILITLKSGQQHTYASTSKTLLSFLDNAIQQLNIYNSR